MAVKMTNTSLTELDNTVKRSHDAKLITAGCSQINPTNREIINVENGYIGEGALLEGLGPHQNIIG